ncbi:MAG: NAD(P)H-hydrate epimerase, partial [Actinomycetota bacterium]|nr:NAD(P)H-hydrate epimerase [Actinomycetota bacterium]
MAAADAATIASGTPGFTLMERAGRAVARAVIALASHRYGLRVAVVCGKGNNGGDGFVAARVLHHNGAGVRCLLLAEASEYVGDAAAHLEILTQAGVAAEPFDGSRLEGCDVIVDAIFGTGFRGAAEGRPAEAIEAINDAGASVVAVDVPSGVAGETGAVEGPAVRAEVTVTMAAQKLGTALAPGSIHAGDVSVVDIGIAIKESTAFVAEPDDIRRLLPARARDAHKRSSGSVVVLAGSDGMSGAALLAARGASRMGAGYVTLVSTSYVDHAKRAIIPEVVSRVAVDHSELGPEVLDEFAADIERAGAVALGPGIGRGKRQRALVEAVLDELAVPLVVDADALNELAEDVSPLEDRSASTVITPHPGEMGTLLGMSAAEIQA